MLALLVWRTCREAPFKKKFILVREGVDALFVAPSGFFSNRRIHVTNLAMRHGIPATYSQREFPEIGGLMSYGTNLTDAWRQVGAYASRVLKGAKPADLPVQQPTRYDLVIPVSPPNFLENFSLLSRFLYLHYRVSSKACRQIPYAFEHGILWREQGGILAPEEGIRPRTIFLTIRVALSYIRGPLAKKQVTELLQIPAAQSIGAWFRILSPQSPSFIRDSSPP